MRYLVKGTGICHIWPGDLRGLTAAIKQAHGHSVKHEGSVTISVHEPGRVVKFRVYNAGDEVWSAEPDTE